MTMCKQSRDRSILLTRPAAQSLRFAHEIKLSVPDVPIVISPLMAPRYLMPLIPAVTFSAVILVSVAAVEAARLISAAGEVLPKLAYCVGNQTALAARMIGFQTQSANGAAKDLLAMITAQNTPGPLLFLRGQDSTGNIAENLTLAGLETISIIVYQQVAQQLSPVAMALLARTRPVIVPLFSPRSARLFQTQLSYISVISPIWVAALSPAIAAALDHKALDELKIAGHPDSASMIGVLQDFVSMGAMP